MIFRTSKQERQLATVMTWNIFRLWALFLAFCIPAFSGEPSQQQTNVCPFVASVGENVAKFGFINASGEVVIPPKYSHVFDADDTGVTRVSIGGDIGCVDENGIEIFPPKFRYISRFSGNRLAVEYTEHFSDFPGRMINGKGETHCCPKKATWN